MNQPQSAPRSSEKLYRPVKAAVAVVAILLGTVGPGLVAIKLSDPDMGKKMTVAEFKVVRRQMVLRMQDNPAIPPQAKAAALSSLERFGGEGR